ncbi:bifunctional lysylphosphatidylglycerol flippase/synthetase MprF [Streptomyces sp. HUAS ZL42]|uniref:bifunctional lysylphosphatidylglycerol flippase/synthetase MprF n=1 Tax=Streptomyces sp. HUAS ZL42 TaxID=3231715 RepID=UPI00345E8CE6
MTGTIPETDIALDAIQRYPDSDNPSAYFAFNEGNSYFRLPDTPGVIVYRPVGRYLVQFGGPFAPAESRSRLLAAFVGLAAEQGREIVSVQLQAKDGDIYVAQGFTVNQMGASYVVDLESFTLAGTRFMQLRNKISRALRSGLKIYEAPFGEWEQAVRALDRAWLGTKGEGVKPLEFLVGQTGGRYQELRRLFVAEREGELIGYVSYAPVYGSRAGWMHDLSRRLPDAPPGVMEAVNKTAIDVFRAEGANWLHFGFTPFTSLTAPQFPGYSRAFHWFMNHLWEHGAHIYPARTQLDYKEKWAPSVVLPEYIAFQHRASLPALVHVFRACNAV